MSKNNTFYLFNHFIYFLFLVPLFGYAQKETNNLTETIVERVKFEWNMNPTNSMVQDKTGFIWIGTGQGLLRFDGKKFKRYVNHPENSNSLVGNYIRRLFLAKNGLLLLGTLNGLSVFNPDTNQFTNFKHDINDSNSIPGNMIFALGQKSKDSFWLGTRGGLAEINIKTLKVIQHPITNGSVKVDIRSLLVDKDNGLWLGTTEGLLKKKHNSDQFEQIHQEDDKSRYLGGKMVQGLFQSNDGNVWVATRDQGAAIINIKSGALSLAFDHIDSPTLKKHVDVELIKQVNKDEIWIGNYGGGITILDAATYKFKKHLNSDLANQEKLMSGDISDILVGKGGEIWISTFSNGLHLFNPHLQAPLDDTGKNTNLLDDIQSSPVITDVFINDKLSSFENNTLLLPVGADRFSVEFTTLDYTSQSEIKYAYMLDGYDNDWIYIDSKNKRATYTNISPGNYLLKIKSTKSGENLGSKETTLAVIKAAAWYEMLLFQSIILFLVISLIILIYKWRFKNIIRQKQRLDLLVEERTKQLQQTLSEVEKLSLTDQLTKLNNRHFLAKNINHRMADLQRENYAKPTEQHVKLGILLIDVDYFKKTNDSYGHSAGDKVLVQIANILTNSCRKTDWIVRWGGEEFLVLGKFNHQDEIKILAEKIIANIEDFKFDIGNNIEVNCTCSSGLTSFPFDPYNQELVSWEEAINIADLSLFIAKDSGRNTWASMFAEKIKNKNDFYTHFISDYQSKITSGEVILDTRKGHKVFTETPIII